MKRLISIICFCVAMSATVSAENVDAGKAVVYARKALLNLCAKNVSDDANVVPITDGNAVRMFVVNFKEGGWVMLSANDAAAPVLGYSETGSFSVNEMPENITSWIDDHKVFFADLEKKQRALGFSPRHEDWDAIENGTYGKRDFRATRASNTVAPLITVNWNQSGSYSVYCPSDKNGRAVVGCVAVGMAQAMSVCQYPDRGVGMASYLCNNYGTLYVNFDAEPDYDWNAIMTGANSKDEVARLLYHCGVSVKMDYSPSGSGSQGGRIPAALINYFKYPGAVSFYTRDAMEDGEWKRMLQNELTHGRALIYCGADLRKSYGHCFNIDGWDGDNFYHVNWGWGGANNGYFSIDALRDATMDMNYDAQQSVVIGVRPPSDKPSDIILNNNKVAENMPVGTIVGKIKVDSEAQNPQYTFKIEGPYSPILHRKVAAPFEVVDGNLVTTKVLTVKDNACWDIAITVTNVKNKASYTKNFSISVVSADAIEAVAAGRAIANGVFDMSGRRICDSVESLPRSTHGIYIVRTANGATKISR